jgi:NADPH:quinone reductase-like Zn-dependent oxidoreductase
LGIVSITQRYRAAVRRASATTWLAFGENRRDSKAPQASSGTKGDIDTEKKVVVAGASGLIGVAALEAFLSAGWEVVAISRRKPVLPSGRNFEFISVDLRDRP